MKLFLTIFFLIFINSTFSQNISCTSLTDILGNKYFITNSKLEKISADNSILYTYSNLDLGDLSSVDVSNPFKILLFYQNFNKVIILDNKLSEQETINLDFIINNICWYTDGNFLIYDNNENYFYVYDNKNKKIISSKSFKTNNAPILLLVQSNKTIFITKEALFFLDNFLKFEKKIDFKIDGYSIFKDEIIIFNSMGKKIVIR